MPGWFAFIDWGTFLSSAATSLGLSGLVVWIGKQWVSHRFKTAENAQSQAIRQGIEEALQKSARDAEYHFEARRRLYNSIGPLRFQLLIAARDLANHIISHGTRGYGYSMELNGYYGQTSLYKILRPIALAELIERQMAYADFAIDSAASDLLIFQKNIYKSMCGGRLIANHPNIDWTSEKEHVFSNTLTKIANSILVSDGDYQRPMLFHEFEDFLSTPQNQQLLAPLPILMAKLQPTEMPIFWTRLVVYARFCAHLVNAQGQNIGFAPIHFDFKKLMTITSDSHFKKSLSSMDRSFEEALQKGL